MEEMKRREGEGGVFILLGRQFSYGLIRQVAGLCTALENREGYSPKPTRIDKGVSLA